MHVCGVAREQYASLAVGRRLPGHVGETGDPRRAVHPVVRPVDGDECLADILAGWARRCVRGAVRSVRPVPTALLRPADATTPAQAELRLLVHLDLGDQPAGRSDPTPGTRCRPPFGSRCVLRRTRRGSPPGATGRRTARRRRRCRPARSPSPHVREAIGTPSSPTQAASMRSKWLCHSASP